MDTETQYPHTQAMIDYIRNFLNDPSMDANQFSFDLPDQIYDEYDAIKKESVFAAEEINAYLPEVFVTDLRLSNRQSVIF